MNSADSWISDVQDLRLFPTLKSDVLARFTNYCCIVLELVKLIRRGLHFTAVFPLPVAPNTLQQNLTSTDHNVERQGTHAMIAGGSSKHFEIGSSVSSQLSRSSGVEKVSVFMESSGAG